MKNISSKMAAVLLTAAFALALAGCKANVRPADTDLTDAPKQTTEAPTAEPTEAPAEAPTEAPAEAPTEAPTEAPLPVDPEAVGDCIKDAEVLLHLPYGEDEGSVGYEAANEENGYGYDQGPQSFCVSDGKVFVLDQVKDRIVVSENGEASFIPLSESVIRFAPASILVIDGTLYASSAESETDHLIAVDMSGNEIESIPLPETLAEDGTGVYYLTLYEGKLAFMDDGLTLWAYEEGKFEIAGELGVERIGADGAPVTDSYDAVLLEISFGDKLIKIEKAPNARETVVGTVNGRLFTKMYEYPDGKEKRSFRVFDLEGNLLAAFAEDPDKVLSFPDTDLFVDTDGTLYVMCRMEDGLYVTMPKM